MDLSLPLPTLPKASADKLNLGSRHSFLNGANSQSLDYNGRLFFFRFISVYLIKLIYYACTKQAAGQQPLGSTEYIELDDQSYTDYVPVGMFPLLS